MASEPQKLKRLKAVLAKRATANWVNSLHQSIDNASDIVVTNVVTSSTSLPESCAGRVVLPTLHRLQQNDRVSDSHNSLRPEESRPQLALNAAGHGQTSSSLLSAMPQPINAEPCGLSKLQRLSAALGALSSLQTMRQPASAKQCSFSKLEQLKAVLEESKRKNSASPQDVPPPLMSTPPPLMSAPKPSVSTPSPLIHVPKPSVSTPPPLIPAPEPSVSTPPPLIPASLASIMPPPLIPATLRVPAYEERPRKLLERRAQKTTASQSGDMSTPPLLERVPSQGDKVAPDCTSPVANQTCDKRDGVREPVVQTAGARPSEKVKRLRELLERQAQKKTASQSKDLSTLCPLEQVSGQGDKVAKDAPLSLACSEAQLECSESSGHFSPARLPLGMRVPVVFLSIGDKNDVLFVQELFAQHGLVKMMEQLNVEVPELSQPIEDCVPGTVVAVLRQEDSTWYRGLICPPRKNCEKDNNRSEDKLRVLFIDYGRTANVPVANLLYLPAVFQRLPAFAIPVTLHGLPQIHLPNGTSFSGEVFDAEVVTNSEPCQSVRLYIRNDNLCLNDTLTLYTESAS